MRMKYFLRSLVADERAATAIEYGLIIGLISIFILGAVSALGDSLSGLWNSVSSDVDQVMD